MRCLIMKRYVQGPSIELSVCPPFGLSLIHIFSERTGRIIIVSCTDNLIKGAAGQAIQNFNLMNGLDETLGLPRTAWYL